jgi:hypothetical protein
MACICALAASAAAGAAKGAPTAQPDSEISMVVMDPLALPLSCPCVAGYKRKRMLGEYLTARLGTPS